MELGIVGTGNMGGILTRGFCTSPLVQRVYVCNRTREKAERLAAHDPERISVCADSVEVARRAQWVFLCVRPREALDILPQLRAHMATCAMLIATSSSLTLDDLDAALPCACAKLIPSITQEVRSGALLLMTGARVCDEQKRLLLELLGSIGQPISIPEEQLRVFSDLTSCGPAFVADWLQGFAAAAARRGVPEDVGRQLLEQMIQGVGALCKEGYTLDDIVQRVAVPGGVTREGLEVLRRGQAEMFDALLAATARRQDAHQSEARRR